MRSERASTFVKICGITRPEDADRAVECGADALGFVFWPDSPRWIDPNKAWKIVATLPPFVTAVGVFVNQPSEYVNEIAAQIGLGAVQLHGDEHVEYAATVSRPVLKAMTLAQAADRALDSWPSRVLVLLDAHDPDKRGGTGMTIDWTSAAAVAASRRIVLAGGLTPANVGQAIARVRPFGIDVSSGVEQAPGVKDHEMLEALFAAIDPIESSQGTLWKTP